MNAIKSHHSACFLHITVDLSRRSQGWTLRSARKRWYIQCGAFNAAAQSAGRLAPPHLFESLDRADNAEAL